MPGDKDEALRALVAKRGNRVFRTRDAKQIYGTPAAELARLADQGVTAHVATGYWALVPDLERGRWRPETAAIALGLAAADYGRDETALIGATAVRYHGAWPRALAAAIVATPKQRPTLQTAFGEIRFAKREVATLDTEAIQTEVATGWVTTLEQTILDIAGRPELAGDATTAQTMLTDLLGRADIAHLVQLARKRKDWRALLGKSADIDGPTLSHAQALASLLAAQKRRRNP